MMSNERHSRQTHDPRLKTILTAAGKGRIVNEENGKLGEGFVLFYVNAVIGHGAVISDVPDAGFVGVKGIVFTENVHARQAFARLKEDSRIGKGTVFLKINHAVNAA